MQTYAHFNTSVTLASHMHTIQITRATPIGTHACDIDSYGALCCEPCALSPLPSLSCAVALLLFVFSPCSCACVLKEYL